MLSTLSRERTRPGGCLPVRTPTYILMYMFMTIIAASVIITFFVVEPLARRRLPSSQNSKETLPHDSSSDEIVKRNGATPAGETPDSSVSADPKTSFKGVSISAEFANLDAMQLRNEEIMQRILSSMSSEDPFRQSSSSSSDENAAGNSRQTYSMFSTSLDAESSCNGSSSASDVFNPWPKSSRAYEKTISRDSAGRLDLLESSQPSSDDTQQLSSVPAAESSNPEEFKIPPVPQAPPESPLRDSVTTVGQPEPAGKPVSSRVEPDPLTDRVISKSTKDPDSDTVPVGHHTPGAAEPQHSPTRQRHRRRRSQTPRDRARSRSRSRRHAAPRSRSPRSGKANPNQSPPQTKYWSCKMCVYRNNKLKRKEEKKRSKNFVKASKFQRCSTCQLAKDYLPRDFLRNELIWLKHGREKPWTCKNCGRGNRAQKNFSLCDNCGTPYHDHENFKKVFKVFAKRGYDLLDFTAKELEGEIAKAKRS